MISMCVRVVCVGSTGITKIPVYGVVRFAFNNEERNSGSVSSLVQAPRRAAELLKSFTLPAK